MAQSVINWKQGDYISLGKAVSNFNKKIRKLQAEEKMLYLPNEINYQETKKNITTRAELNRVINSLKRFQKEGAEDLYITQSGELLTNWERKELGIQKRIAKTRLTKELKTLNEPTESGYSLAQMGSSRVKEINLYLKNLDKVEQAIGKEFESLKKRIQKVGTSDYSMKRAITYRKNYVREMEKYSHYDNYDKLLDFFNNYKNPVAFYEKVSENELSKDLTYQSDQYYSQEAFNSFLQDLGIEIEIDSTS